MQLIDRARRAGRPAARSLGWCATDQVRWGSIRRPVRRARTWPAPGVTGIVACRGHTPRADRRMSAGDTTAGRAQSAIVRHAAAYARSTPGTRGRDATHNSAGCRQDRGGSPGRIRRNRSRVHDRRRSQSRNPIILDGRVITKTLRRSHTRKCARRKRGVDQSRAGARQEPAPAEQSRRCARLS